jgi:hypothetical protein
MVLTPKPSATAVLECFLGSRASEVWFDDAHLQADAHPDAWRARA